MEWQIIATQISVILREVLKWLVFGPGAGLLTYRIMEIPKVGELIELAQGKVFYKLGTGPKETKRLVAFGLSWLLAISGYTTMLLLGFDDPSNLATTFFTLSGFSTVTSQVAHGRTLDKEE